MPEPRFYGRLSAISPRLLRCRRCTIRGRVVRNLQPCRNRWWVTCYACLRQGPESATRAGAVRGWSVMRLSHRPRFPKYRERVARDSALARVYSPEC